MAQYPNIITESTVKPVNNLILSNDSPRGAVEFSDFSGVDSVQQRNELYEVTLKHPRMPRATLTTLETFFFTNKLLTVTTQVLSDGYEYMGFMTAPPEATKVGGMFDIKVTLTCWRGVVANPLVHLDETTIVGSAPVTEWTNRGTGGSGYDLNVPMGTPANLLTDTLNGLTCLLFDGTVAIEASSGLSDLTDPIVIFAVVQLDNPSPGEQKIVDSRTSSSKRHSLFTDNSNDDKFSIEQGTVRGISNDYDTDAHVWAAEFNGDATSKLTVSGLGTTGEVDAGSETMQFLTVGGTWNASSFISGKFSELVIYNTALSETEVNQVTQALRRKWGTK